MQHASSDDKKKQHIIHKDDICTHKRSPREGKQSRVEENTAEARGVVRQLHTPTAVESQWKRVKSCQVCCCTRLVTSFLAEETSQSRTEYISVCIFFSKFSSGIENYSSWFDLYNLLYLKRSLIGRNAICEHIQIAVVHTEAQFYQNTYKRTKAE